jgi:hypothetical protein
MKIETIPNYFIHITAEEGKELVNGDNRAKEIYVPLDGDYSMWVEEDELIIPEIIIPEIEQTE